MDDQSKNAGGDFRRRWPWRNVVKTDTSKIDRACWRDTRKNVARLLALAALLVLPAGRVAAQVTNNAFTNATAISGLSGTLTDSNVGADTEACEPTLLNNTENAPTPVFSSIWYAWTAPTNGPATIDTIGSDFDTVLAVYTTPTGLCDGARVAVTANDDGGGIPNGPSVATFTGIAGTRYYISVNGYGLAPTGAVGNVILNWSQVVGPVPTIPSGTFSFSSSIFRASEQESGGAQDGSLNPSYSGANITIARTAGSSGRVLVDFSVDPLTYTNSYVTNLFGTNFITVLINSNNFAGITNDFEAGTIYNNRYGYYGLNGYRQFPVDGYLTNSLTVISNNTPLLTPIFNGAGQLLPNWAAILNAEAGMFVFNFTNFNLLGGQPAGAIPTNLPPIGSGYFGIAIPNTNAGTVAIYITNRFRAAPTTNTEIVPSYAITHTTGTLVFDDFQMSAGVLVSVDTNTPELQIASLPTLISLTLTNARLDAQESSDLLPPNIGTPALLNVLHEQFFSDMQTNDRSLAYLNIEHAHLRVSENTATAVVNVHRVGNLNQASSCSWRIDFPNNNTFALQAGSDYAIPGTDFVSTNGTVTFAAGSDYAAFSVPIIGDNVPDFDKDMRLEIYGFSAGSTNGDIRFASLTIQPDGVGQLPAGAVDVTWNKDRAADSVPPQLQYPGTQGGKSGSANGNGGNVYALAEQPDGKTIVAGSFVSFDSNPYNRLVRLLNNGYQDTTFMAGLNSGANAGIYALALQSDGKVIIGGDFTSFNGVNRQRIARLNTNGTVDATFNPGLGANATVQAVKVRTDGKILIGGNFTTVNGAASAYIARLNADGSRDTSFNVGSAVNGPVYAIESAGSSVQSVNVSGGPAETVTTINLGNSTSGFLNVAYNVAGPASDMQVYYGDRNGLLIYDTGAITATNSFTLPFSPQFGLSTNILTIVMNPGGGIPGTAWNYTASVLTSGGTPTYIGGAFNAVSGVACGGVARLQDDGSLDPAFVPGIGAFNPDTGNSDAVHALALQPDGSLLVGGSFSYFELASYNGIVRLLSNGSVDESFNPGTGTYDATTGESDTIYRILLQPDGKILIGGDFAVFNQTRRWSVARLFSYGSLDTSFMDTAYNQFAGLVNHYHNADAVNNTLYPAGNHRNSVRALALEPGTANVLIGGSFLQVGGGTSRTTLHPRSNVARLIGGATAGPGNISLQYGSYTVDKSAGTLYVSMLRGNGSLGPAAATFFKTLSPPGPGIANDGDFTVSNATPTWPTIYSVNNNSSWAAAPGEYGPNYNEIPLGNNQADEYLGINNNSNFTGNVSAALGLKNPAGNLTLGGIILPLGVALGTNYSAPLTIIENNFKPGVIGYAFTDFATNQNAGTATITVTRTNGTDGIVSVNYTTTTNGTAIAGTNYSPVSGVLTFNQGVSSRTFTIPVIGGSIVQPDKTVGLALSAVTGGATIGLTNATLTIINNNFTSGHVSFTLAGFDTNEPATTGAALISVNRLGGSAGTLTVTFAATNGTAVNGTNFTGVTNALSWGNGDVATKIISVPLKHDGVFTPDLTVTLRLYNPLVSGRPNTNALGLNTNVLLTIHNIDFPGTVQFVSDRYSVKKYGGFAWIPVVRTNGSAQTISVNFNTTDGTATAPGQYAATNGMLTFTNGEVGKLIKVPIVNTNDNAGPVNLTVSLTGTFASPLTNTTLNIIDTDTVNEPPGDNDAATYSSSAGFNGPVFALGLQPGNNKLYVAGDFTQANGVPRQRIARLNAGGTLDATFSAPSTTMGADAAVRALLVQSDGRVVIGGFFTNVNSVVNSRIARLNQDGLRDSLFNPGSGADNPVYALAETFLGGDRKILVGGSFATLNGSTFHAVGRLNDDGTPDTTFNLGGLGANATVYALAVQADGKAIIGGAFTNYNGVAVGRVARLNVDGSLDASFTGAGANDTVFAVAVQLDGKILIGGAFTNVNGVALNHVARLNSDGSLDTGFTPGVGADDLVSAIALQSDTRIVLGGQFLHCSGVTRSRITRLNPDGTMDPMINFGTGADGFVSAIAIQQDTIEDYPANVPDEKIIIGGGFANYNGEAHKGIARIFGGAISGVGLFGFTVADFYVNENVSAAVVTVLRSGGTMGTNANGSGSVSVPFTTSDGTAFANTNYLTVTTNVVFAVGEVLQNVTIPIIRDNLITPDLEVNLAVNPVLPADYGDQPTAVLHIVNADSEVNFASATYQVTKNIINGVAAINLVRGGGSLGTASVIFNTTTNGSATAGIDYTPVTNQLVTFGPGVTSVVVNIPIINNALPEGFRTVGLSLTAPVNTAVYSPSNAVLTIIDTVNSPGQIAFSQGNYNAAADGTNAQLTVIRTNGSTGTLTVSYQTRPFTALPGTDYVSTNGTLTFGPGVVSQIINVPVIPQVTVKPPVFFTVGLSNLLGGGQFTDPSNAFVTLSSSTTNTYLTFAVATNNVQWNGTNVTLTVLRLYNSTGTTTVPFGTTNGTALAGTHYAATTGTLTFTNGQTQRTITVPIIANTQTAGSQTFTVGLGTPSGTASLLPPSVATVVIHYPGNLPPGFNNPLVIYGDWGTTNADNSSAQLLLGSPLIWFSWTPTNSGQVQFDSIGSADDILGITNLITYMGVFTGTNQAALNTVTINAGMYPNAPLQYNLTAQNTFALSLANPVASSGYFQYSQPFNGPSRVLFNAVAGQTYLIAVASAAGTIGNVITPPTGLVSLNWAIHPSGVFRFAQEDVDQTGLLTIGQNGFIQTSGLTYSNGIPMLLYRVSETEASRRWLGTVEVNHYNSTLYGTFDKFGNRIDYEFDAPGLLVTVTRVAGSSGRVKVDYTTSDIPPGSSLMGTNGYLVNGDLPASSGFVFTNFGITIPGDYKPASGTLVFDDSEMSKTIFIPVNDDGGQPQPNRDFLITLTNTVLDAGERLQAPRLDRTFSTALVRILDADISPQGFSRNSTVFTNVIGFPPTTNITTNVVWNAQPTNGVYNFMKAHYQVTRDASDYWGGTPITLYVTRKGTNNAASSGLHWRVNQYYLNKAGGDLANGFFPLQAGSDYATPTPPNSVGILGLVPDFNFAGGYSGTISFPSGNGAFDPQPITFTVANNRLQQFNEDFTVSLYEEDSHGLTHPVGMIDQTTVTILTDDNHPPAGSVDEYHNSDFSYNMLAIHPTVPPQMARPGTDGEVFGLAVQPDNKTILVGDFFSYDTVGRNSIARANADGSLDTTFDPGSGVNSFISAVALTASLEVVIAGDFTSYGGQLRNGIALLNSNGSLDPTFYPGTGFNGTVFSLALQPDGRILAGGDFTTYNGTPRRYLARLNLDGTLDTTFDPGTNLNASVNAIGLQSNGQVIIGGDFTQAGGVPGQNYVARLNVDGSFDATFNPGSGGNAPVLSLGIQPDDRILVGGSFTQMNGRNQNHIARLTANGFIDSQFFAGTGLDGPVYNILVNTNAIFSTGPNNNAPVQSGITIYIGGAFTAYNDTHRLGFARLNSDGTLDTTFLDTAYNEFAGLPREHFGDPLGTVLTSGLQTDGNVMIGGSFQRVGGGQADDYDVRPESTDITNLLTAEITGNGYSLAQKSRNGIRNRNNFARLIGGATPGPGNVGLGNDIYSINKSQTPMFVTLLRTNGTLGPATANFSVLPGLAKSGTDYNFTNVAPTYWISWEFENPMGRMHSDGLFGTNGSVQDVYNRYVLGTDPLTRASVTMDILNSGNNFNNLNAQFQMSDPIGRDQFYLGGQDIPLGLALGRNLSPLTIIDDHHQSGVFGFSASNYVGTGSSAALTVTRTNGTFGVVSMSYSTYTNGSTAIAGSDYLPASGTLSFNAGVTSQGFSIQLLNTNYNSAVEKFVNVGLFNLNPPFNGLASFGQTNTILRIINPNFQGFLGLSAASYAANLSAQSVIVTVNRTVGSKGTLTVQFATTNGTALSGTDFAGVTNTLTWNNGDVTPRAITIPLINNGLVGAGKLFGVALSNPTFNGAATPSLFSGASITNAVVNIGNDNSYGSFQFSSPTYVVNEQGGYANLTVIRTGGTNGSATVNFATTNNTAFAATNFVATNTTLTFNAGQLAAAVKVRILNDGLPNPPPSAFYFNASLSGASAGASVGTLSNAAVQIVDASNYNRPPGADDTTFNPGAGMNGDVLALALQSSGQIIAGGNFITVSGVPENYLARLNPDGSLDRSGFFYGLAGLSGTAYALAVQTDDQILVGGVFTNINGTVLNRIARLNNDGSVDSSFNPGAGADNTVYGLAETFVGGARKIYAVGAFNTMNGVARPNLARLNNDGTVDLAFNPGTGPNGTVYAVAAYPTNSVFAGKLLIGGSFTNVNGLAVRGIARLNVDGSTDTNFDLNLNAAGTVRTVAIQDDDAIVFGGDFTNVNAVARGHLARLNSDGSLDGAFAPTVGNATNGAVNAIRLQLDGRIVAVGQFNAANGVTRNSITRLMPDGTTDPTINFGLGANGSVNALVLQPADQMLVIGGGFTQYDGSPAGHIARVYGGSIVGSGAFRFTTANYSVHESGVQAAITIRRVGGTSGPNLDGSGNVQVTFVTSNGTAIAGVNYSNVLANVVFPPGEVFQAVPVLVKDDSNITANLTVNLALTNPTAPAILGDQATALLTIINDDNAVKFASAGFSVAKNVPTGVGTLLVTRIGTTNGNCTVNYFTTTNGTAVSGSDYVPTNGTITFGNGDTVKPIQIPVINNNVVTGNRTVNVVLTNATGTLLNSPSNATLTIVDTVNAAGILSFAATNYTANASDGDVYLTVQRTFGTSGSVSATFTTVPGTAAYPLNYSTVSGTVSFNDGDTFQTFPVHVNNNLVPQPPVSLQVQLSAPNGGASLLDPTNTTLTIINTNVGVAFVLATNTVNETAGTVLAYVQRYGSTNGTTTVNFATHNGTAHAGVNYQGTSGTLTFLPGQTLKPVPVTLIGNPQVTGDLAFTVTLASAAGATIIAPAATTVLMQDQDAGVSFDTSTNSVLRSLGTVTVNVICSNPRVEPVLLSTNIVPLQVNYYTVDGTALANVDYHPVSGTLVFTNGLVTNSFTVPILNNSFVSGSRAFSLVLTNPTAPGQIVSPGVETVTIVDSNAGLRFSGGTYSVFKDAGNASITVYRTGYTNSTATVNYSATNGTAVNGANFTAASGTLTFTNGETVKSFNVPILPNNLVQPNLTVLLQLSSPGNGYLVAPSAATLTILENSGSYIIPAGAQILTESGPVNGIVDNAETLTVLFGLRDSAGLNVTNLNATLLAGNGVNAPSGPQVYGNLQVYGHSVSRPFTFTASGTNGQAIAPTFNLYSTVNSTNKFIGTAVFGFTLGTQTANFAGTNPIVINDNTNASPYPAVIQIAGVGGTLIKATVTLSGLYHSSPSDVDALVVCPSGTNTLIMANAGAQNVVTNIVLTFDDSVTNRLTQQGRLATGTNQPTAYLPVKSFP
jgi:uncharacterized delta-60 repeat protein